MKFFTCKNTSFTVAASVLLSMVFGIVLSKLTISDLGLLSSYSPLCWIAFALICVWMTVSASKESFNSIRFVLILFFVVLMYAYPYFLEFTPRFRTGYWYLGQALYLQQNSHLNSAVAPYHTFPGFFILVTILSDITSLHLMIPIQAIFPALISAIYILPLQFLFKRAGIRNGSAWFATWFVLYANWTEQSYFSAQAVGLIFLFFVVGLIVGREKLTTRHTLLFVVFFMVLTLTHELTAIIAFVIIIGLSILSKTNRNLVAISAFILAGWTVLNALPFVLSAVSSPGLFNPISLFFVNVGSRLSGSPIHTLIIYDRIGLSALVAGLGAVSFSFIVRKNQLTGNDRNMILMTLILMPLILVNIYSSETFERFFIFLLIPVSYFIARYFTTTRSITILILIIIIVTALPLNVIARYGSERVDYVPPAELTGTGFVYSFSTSGTLVQTITSNDRGPFGISEQIGSYRYYAIMDRPSEASFLSGNRVWAYPTDANMYLFVPAISFSDFTYVFGNDSIPKTVFNFASGSSGWDLVYNNPSGWLFHFRH